MKKTLATLALVLLALTAQAQTKQIPQSETTLSDLIEMLRLEGYESFSYDLTSLLDDKYTISVISKEYTDGHLVNEETLYAVDNKTMISDFQEEDQKEILEENSADDPEHGVYKQADKMQLAFYPINQAEKKRDIMISIDKMGISKRFFNLKSVKVDDRECCNYEIRPFEVQPMIVNEFHPLLLLVSWWYDEHFKIFRCCGENEIAPNLSSDILKYSLHYFVIGVKVTKE